MKVVKKKYEEGGKIGKLKKAVKKNQDEKYLTKDGKKRNIVKDGDIGTGRREMNKKFGSGENANDKRDAKENTKVANEILAELKAEYKKLSPEERKGEKGEALRKKMQTERDSKRGNSKYFSDLATGKDGKVRVIGYTGR